ncbi:amino acid ABC transporter permease [Mesorhizobium sp.]|uniref:amino acid ABC transporter permease n=1 Tax=Mesorhizobium sp. TaxID=1871066 RepID=UPI000FEA2409|nr:amino acid ABC transporter permease [Mesorhizobium sp.]RWC30011.1 MAG: amino acid ABC transporter permease [Mesorhizobium sp.]TIX28164.1 MAG: amino acid ABC transporter permease [Mesorhizobium sp.]
MNYKFLWAPVAKALPELAAAAFTTLQVSVLAMVAGTAIGLGLAFAKLSAKPLARYAAGAWIETARNTPVLFQLYFCYFGLGAFGLFLGSYFSVVVALTFNTAGYMAETFRGGLNAIHPSQYKLARAMGLKHWQAQLHVIVPQLLRIVYLPMTNQFIWVILMSSLGMLVGLRELSGEAQFQFSKTFRAFEFFLATAVIYYLIAKLALGLSHLLARFFLKSERVA